MWATGKILATVLNELFCIWGACNSLVSDNGPQMISRHVAELCILLGVKQVFTTPYHTQSNWVEWVNTNIVSMLCCFVKGRLYRLGQTCDGIYVCIEFLSPWGYSPAELFSHWKLQGPGEWVGELPLHQNSKEMFKNARINMKRINSRNKIA